MQSTKSRKSAFARKPRGDPKSSTGPAKIVINRDFLSKVKESRLDDSLNDILTSVGGSLNLEFAAQGGTTITIKDRRDDTLADNTDVMRIMNMNSYLTKEKAKVIKESGKTTIVRALWAIKEYVNGLEGIHVQENLPVGIRDIVQKMQAILLNLKANYDQVVAQTDLTEMETAIKGYLDIVNVRIRNAVVKHLVAKFANYEEAASLNEKLFEEKVPIWVFSKLTGQKMNLSQKGFEFVNILFPKDPAKGMCLSFREIRDLNFLRAQGPYILSGTYFAHLFMADNEFVQSFCNIQDVTDAETMKTLANVPILVTKPGVTVGELTDRLAEQGVRQYSWPVGYAVSPKDNLQFLGTLFKRASVVALTRPQLQVDLIQSLFPGFTYDTNNRAANIFQQLKTQAQEEGRVSLSSTVLSGGVNHYNNSPVSRCVVRSLLLTILDIAPGDETRVNIVSRILHIEENGTFTPAAYRYAKPVPEGFTLGTDTWGPISVAANSVDVRNDQVVAFNEATKQKVSVKAEKKVSLARQTAQTRTLITAEAKSVLALTKALKYRALVPVLESFFCSFLTQKVQSAVARLMLARMDQVLAKPIKLTRKDISDILDVGALDDLGDTLGFEDDSESEGEDEIGPGDDENDNDVPDTEVPP